MSFEMPPDSGNTPASANVPIHMQIAVRGSHFCMPPMLRMSCSSASAWMTTPAPMNSSALKKACVIRWKMPVQYAPRPTPTNMYAIWLIVEKAMMRLMSVCVSAVSPAISRPATPIATITCWIVGAYE